MKYITILEANKDEASNVGTISVSKDVNSEPKFKEAIEAHFDAELKSYSFVDSEITNLTDCLNASAIDVIVKLNDDNNDIEHTIELTQTWLY